MITTFLWMLYLAFMICSTFSLLVGAVNIVKNQKITKTQILNIIVCSLLWSIWYFYYLN